MRLISGLLGWFANLKLAGQLAIGAGGLFLFFGACFVFSTLLTGVGPAASATQTSQGADSLLMVTWTPAFLSPTSSVTPTSTPAPTRTPLPTSLPTRSFETPTVVILKSTIGPSTYAARLVIVGIDKELEYVDIQNIGDAPAYLIGWVLVSEKGDQRCTLNGILQTKEVLRIWAGIGPVGSVGYNCGFPRTIWTASELDPAVLYDPDGQEVSRYPPP
jgi:hypothetical protein